MEASGIENDLDAPRVAVHSIVVERAQADVEITNEDSGGGNGMKFCGHGVITHRGREVHGGDWSVVQDKRE
jgi:hypothetical protein